jgi:predicted  nucleic acid-binding Zn-ribbon protein
MFEGFFRFLGIKTGSAITNADGTVVLTQEQFAQLNERIAAVEATEKAHQDQVAQLQQALATAQTTAQTTIAQLNTELAQKTADLKASQDQLTATVGKPLALGKDQQPENPSPQELLKAQIASFKYNQLANDALNLAD